MTLVESWRSMAESDHYLLGRGEAEEARLIVEARLCTGLG